MSITKLDPPVGDEYEVLITAGMTDYERTKVSNQPTHYSTELIKEGRYRGFDKITYYRKKL